MKKITLKYWQKTYLATLALFLCCLTGSIGAVFSLGQRQNFSSTVNEALAQQQYLMQSLVQDAEAVASSRPAALPNLYEYYATQYAGGGIPLEVAEQGTVLCSTLPAVEGERTRPEVPEGQRVYLVQPTEEGRQLFVSSRLSTVSPDTIVTCAFPMEGFYQEWARIRLLFLIIGGMVSGVFAIALYLVLARMYRPLAQVTGTARAIAAGDLAARAPDKRRDEVGELGRAMNQMAGQVQRKIDELETAASQKQQLIDNLAHEMRTPLTAIGGWAETMQRAQMDPEELMEATDTILFESRRVLALSQQLLKLSVLRGEPLELAPVDAADLLHRVERTIGPKARARQVTFTVLPPAEPVELLADEVLLESLLVNLCDNEVKACAAKGQVRLAVHSTPGRVLLTVTDNGRGMDRETLAHLGEPFYRADKARSRAEGGAGLGLSLCFAIARRHDALMEFESKPGHGTRATVTFTTSQ